MSVTPALPNPLEAIQAAIIARLTDRLPGRFARIDPFPDRPADYDFPLAEGAAAFVQFDGTTYGPAGDGPRGAYTPRRTCRWTIHLLVRSWRGDGDGTIGAFEALEEVRRALQGQSFAGATPMVPVDERLDEESDGAWRWLSRFTNAIPAIAETNFDHHPLTDARL